MQHPLLGPRWLVSAHLDPSSCRKQYLESCTDLVSVLQLCPSDAVTIIGLDAQTCLDGVDGSGFFVGPFTSDNLLPRRPPLADWKARTLLNIISSFGARATNTMFRGPHGCATCFYDDRSEPKQIDYVLATSLDETAADSYAVATEAKQSDHRPVLYKEPLPRSQRLLAPLLDDSTVQTPGEIKRPSKPVG